MGAYAPIALALSVRVLAAQATTLMVTPGTLTFATPSVADFGNGYICAGSITVSTSQASGGPRNDSIFVRATTVGPIPSSPAGSTKPLSDFQWTRSAAGCAATDVNWTSLPASNSAPAFVMVNATPFSTTIYFRLKLGWASDKGGVTYVLPDVTVFCNRSQTIPP
jgi:hypothetical protein